jgi:hypothetical protein
MSNENEDKIKEFVFTLSEPISYASGGEQSESDFITFTAPTSRNRKECAFLKQAFSRVWKERLAENEDNEDSVGKDSGKEDVVDPKALADQIMFILSSGSSDLNDIWETGVKLFASGVGKIGGEVKLTRPLIDRMGVDDLDSAIGEYIANFILR